MSFDSLAPFYRSLETVVFGNALQRARTAFISELKHCRSALVLGEGDGRFVAALLAANQEICVTIVEQSTRMTQLARSRIKDASRVQFINSDIERAVLDQMFDAIVTNFFVDCFSEAELARVVEKVSKHAHPNAIWIVGEFTDVRRGKLLVALMYAFFRLVTRIDASRLPNYAPVLRRHGFRCEERRLFYSQIVSAELWKRD